MNRRQMQEQWKWSHLWWGDFSNFPLVVSPVAFRDKALFVLTVVFRETREKYTLIYLDLYHEYVHKYKDRFSAGNLWLEWCNQTSSFYFDSNCATFECLDRNLLQLGIVYTRILTMTYYRHYC